MIRILDAIGAFVAFVGFLIVKLGMMMIRSGPMRMEFIKFFAALGDTANQTVRKKKVDIVSLHTVSTYYPGGLSAFDVIRDMYEVTGRDSIEQALDEIQEEEQKEKEKWRYST